MTVREIIYIVALLVLIILFIAFRRNSEKREKERLEKEREMRKARLKESLDRLSEEEKNAIISVTGKERSLFVRKMEMDYEAAFHPFPDFEYKNEGASQSLVNDSLGYYVIPKGYVRIAAFFYTGDIDFSSVTAITLNINGMINRRFEGYIEFMKARYFDVKEEDIITIEVEFDGSRDISIRNFGVLLLKKRS